MERGRMQTLTLIWGAMFVSQTLFMVVLFVVAEPSGGGDFDPNLIALFAPAPFLFGMFGVKKLLTQLDAQGMYIVRWACFEATVIFGFVAGFLGASAAVPLGLYAFGVLGLALSRPNEEEYTAWEVDRLGDG
ncbi:MAG: hypothetical protein R3F61_23900 [Myxococcota bacterium]